MKMIPPIKEIERKEYRNARAEEGRQGFERWLHGGVVSNDSPSAERKNLIQPRPFGLQISADNLLILSREKAKEIMSVMPSYFDRDESRENIDENQYAFDFIHDDVYSTNV